MKRIHRFAVALTAPMLLLAACGGDEPAAEPTAAAGTPTPSVAETNTTVATWAEAAALLGIDGSLWEPTKTLGLEMSDQIEVLVQPQFSPVLQYVGARYGTTEKGFRISEKWADAGWAADPVTDIRALPVKAKPIKLGDPDTPATIEVRVVAYCNTGAESPDAEPPAADATCKKKDVKKFGGQLTMTAQPSSTMTSPGDTTVVIDVQGLTFKQLLKIARNLQQVSG